MSAAASSLADVAEQMRPALPLTRRTSYVTSIHVDAELRAGGVWVRCLRAGFSGPPRTLVGHAEKVWIGWVDLHAGSGKPLLGVSGTHRRPSGLPPSLSWPGTPLPLSNLMRLDRVCQALEEHIPAAHRVRLPLELDLGLVCEEGVPRWRVQYEIDKLGFRILHLHAGSGAMLYDRFDEWQS